MPSPAPELTHLLAAFAPAFTRPTFARALTLLYGTILALGRRTVTAALRAVGLGHERRFTAYPRVLNRAAWSPLRLSRRLLALLVATFLAPAAPLVVLADGTLQRRRGRRIAYQGRFRDAVRSDGQQVVTTEGIHWLCLMLLVRVPWSRRPWALPFLSVPTLAPATSARLGKRHHTAVARTAMLVRLVRRWQAEREVVLVGDSSFAAVGLGHACNRQRIRLVSRLLLNAQLYDPPAPRPASTPGPKPKKGKRQPNPAARLADSTTPWQSLTLPWYGGQEATVSVATGAALWHRDGEDPLPLRWVLVRHPDRRGRPVALFCTDQAATAEQILRWYIDRWPVEVTFEEARAHLGPEAQRQWSTRAIGRATPCLLGLFSLVVLLAHARHPQQLPVRAAAWYPKRAPTFIDALAAVRRHLWAAQNRPTAVADGPGVIADDLLDALVEAACYAA